VLEEPRQRYQFVVAGYVAMPEHFHLLISAPEKGDPSLVMKVGNRGLRGWCVGNDSSAQLDLWVDGGSEQVWQKRFYDFNMWSERKRVEKLRYMHRNPVKRGLVATPEPWTWSSFRHIRMGRRDGFG
jgi:putative transposase